MSWATSSLHALPTICYTPSLCVPYLLLLVCPWQDKCWMMDWKLFDRGLIWGVISLFVWMDSGRNPNIFRTVITTRIRTGHLVNEYTSKALPRTCIFVLTTTRTINGTSASLCCCLITSHFDILFVVPRREYLFHLILFCSILLCAIHVCCYCGQKRLVTSPSRTNSKAVSPIIHVATANKLELQKLLLGEYRKCWLL
jgi:hypothetical protein